jgi:hypothetical protein
VLDLQVFGKKSRTEGLARLMNELPLSMHAYHYGTTKALVNLFQRVAKPYIVDPSTFLFKPFFKKVPYTDLLASWMIFKDTVHDRRTVFSGAAG